MSFIRYLLFWHVSPRYTGIKIQIDCRDEICHCYHLQNALAIAFEIHVYGLYVTIVLAAMLRDSSLAA